MQLSEILEENSVKAISAKTNISEDNIELLLADDFANLSRTKALGFISIMEREYSADLSKVKENALAYYDQHNEDQSINLRLPVLEEKKGSSKWGLVLVLALLGYASWYFFTKFDNKNLSAMLPFSEEKVEDVDVPKEEEVEAALSINNALSSTQTDTTGVQTDIVEMSIEPSDANAIRVDESIPKEVKNITLIPENRLWFGIIDMDTGKRDHFSIEQKHEIDVENKSWLIATSSAAFSFVHEEETQEFNDAKEHYFKVSQAGIESLNKAEYVSQGGYRKW